MATFAQLTGLYLDHELRTDDASVLFTSTRRAQAINDGVAEFADLTECFLRTSTVAVSCSVARYSLLSSTDFVRVAARGVEFHLTDSNGILTQLAGDDFPRRDIEVLNREDPGWRQSTTPLMPSGYYLDQADGGFVLGLDVPPDVGSSETAKVLVPYVARPAPMANSTDVPFTVGGNTRTDLVAYHMAAVHYAAHQLEKLRGDEAASDRQYAKFLGYVDRFMGKARQKGATFVRMSRSYLRDAQRTGRGAHDRMDPYRWP